MQIAVVSDIHANIVALKAVAAEIDRAGVDAVYCLGDTVGYGPDASACVDFLRERSWKAVRGNHDEAVALDVGVERLPQAAQVAAAYNREHLSADQLDFLAGLPLVVEENGCTFVHATPDEPHAWRRTDSHALVQAQFGHFETDVCFLGHTHIPAVAGDRVGVLRVRRGHRFLINVGSVGQPRDGSQKACLGLFDTEAFSYSLVRVPYDVDRAARRSLDAGLPASLARRLRAGR